VSFFFEGFEQSATAEAKETALPGDMLADKEALELMRSYYAIPEEPAPPPVRAGARPVGGRRLRPASA
jgi:hypothetical protein